MKNTSNNSYSFLLVPFVVTALLAGTPAYAQEKTAQDLNAEIDKIFSWATPSSPGCTVAASLQRKVVVSKAYGSADVERDVPISPSTIFDIGSVQKQFVAAAVLLLVEDGKLSLSDDVLKHIPQLPDYGHKITIDHLLTHTSGIRDWTGMLMLAEGKPDVLTLTLRQRGLNFAPGEEFSYSSSGFVLAKEIVARTSGMSFAEFTRKRMFEPLGMKSTSYSVDMRDIIKNRALAYNRQGGGPWRMAMMLDNDRGGGGILTTAGDLLIWNDALTNNRSKNVIPRAMSDGPGNLHSVFAERRFLAPNFGTRNDKLTCKPRSDLRAAIEWMWTSRRGPAPARRSGCACRRTSDKRR